MTGGKRQPPLHIAMSFDEALGRFAATDPKKVAEQTEAAGIQPAAKELHTKRKRLVKPSGEKRTDPD